MVNDFTTIHKVLKTRDGDRRKMTFYFNETTMLKMGGPNFYHRGYFDEPMATQMADIVITNNTLTKCRYDMYDLVNIFLTNKEFPTL